MSNTSQAAREAIALTALREIARVATTNDIPDRRGKMVNSCDATCLNECSLLAEEAILALSRLNPKDPEDDEAK